MMRVSIFSVWLSSQSRGTVGGRSRHRSSPKASGKHNTGQVRDTKPADFVLLTLLSTEFRQPTGFYPVDQRSLPLPSIHLPAAIDKALTSSDRTFWIACPLSHHLTPQALVPSIGRNVSSATIQRGMRLPGHFRKLVKLYRLRKRQRFSGLKATFRSFDPKDGPVAPPDFPDPNILTQFCLDNASTAASSLAG